MKGVSMSEGGLSTPQDVRWFRVALAVLGLLGVLLGSVVWAISSPVGSSPDDDFHLTSTWCPLPIEESGCEYAESGGEIVSVLVPETVSETKNCMAFMPEVDASCADGLSDERWVNSDRFDDGNYPGGFYRFHHMLVGEDVHFSALLMRIVNIAIGLGGIALAAALAPPQLRHGILISAMVAWVPMGVYFIGSNNPTSWTISGCLIYAAALLASTDAVRWRKWVLLVLSVAGAALAALSRTDGAFYVFVISLAVWLLVRITKERIPSLVVSVVLSLVVLAGFATSNQAGGLTGSGGWPTSDEWKLSDIFLNNLLTLPEHIGSFWGLTWGPGWFDVPLKGWSTLTMIFAAGGLVFIGARELWGRKVLASLVAAGALLGIPVVAMTIRHVQPVIYYQGRYMLPLLAVVFVIWLSRRSGRAFYLSTGERVALGGVVGVANMMALHSLIVRYAVGTDAGVLIRIGEPEWWPWGIGPMTVWVLGSLAMIVGFAALLAYTGWEVSSHNRAGTEDYSSGGIAVPTASSNLSTK